MNCGGRPDWFYEAKADKGVGQFGPVWRRKIHNYCFDLKTGECVMPRGGPSLTVLPAEERGEEVCIRLEW